MPCPVGPALHPRYFGFCSGRLENSKRAVEYKMNPECQKNVNKRPWTPLKSKKRDGDQNAIVENPGTFNYFDFHRHLQLKAEVKRSNRLHQLISKPNCQLPTFEDLIEDNLAAEFMGIYGPLDLDSYHGKKLFATYKQGKLEQLTKWNKLEKQFVKDSKNSISSPFDLDTLDDLISIQVAEKLHDYEETKSTLYNQNPYANTHNSEWFILPRRKYKKEDYRLVSRKELKIIKRHLRTDELIIEGIDLRIFDPKFETNVVLTRDSSDTLNMNVARRMKRILNKFSVGITIPEISAEYKEMTKHFLDVSMIGASTFSEYVYMLPDLYWRCHMATYFDVVFPQYLKGFIRSPFSVYKKISERIVFLMYRKGGRIKTDSELSFLMWNTFKIEIGSYCTMMKVFIEEYYNKFRPCEESLFFTYADPDNPLLLTFEKLPGISKVEDHKLIPLFPRDYVQIYETDKLEWISNIEVVPTCSQYSICVAGHIESLRRFYVIPVESLDVLKRMMKDMLEIYNSDSSKNLPNPHCLVKNLLVAIKHRDENFFRQEHYYRGMIIDVVPNKNFKDLTTYKVLLIDFGGVVDVQIGNMRYLYKCFLDLPAQAIECYSHWLEFSEDYHDALHSSDPWNETEVTFFKNQVKLKMLGVRFRISRLHFLQTESGKGQKLKAIVNVVDQNDFMKDILPNVGLRTIETIQGCYMGPDYLEESTTDVKIQWKPYVYKPEMKF